MDALQETTSHLRAIGAEPPTPERWNEVTAALESKFEGIQVVAARVLATWGGRAAVETLRPWLVKLCDRPDSFHARGAAAKVLAQCVEAQDTEWVLDLYFGLPDALLKHDLLPLIEVLPPDRVRPRVLTEARSPEAINRQAALKAVARIRFPDRRELLRLFVHDPQKVISSTAKVLLSREA